jgi:uncharacterized protein (TIGR03118 family)
MNKNLYIAFLTVIVASFAGLGCKSSSSPSSAAPPGFIVTPLAANNASYGAPNTDTNLRDTWGLAFSGFGTPWVANRASGTSTIYDTLGVPIAIVYHIKGPGGTVGNPTGIVSNTAITSFPVEGVASSWIYSELSGVIAALPSGATDSTIIVANRSASASYTGLALVTGSSGPMLYAPNIINGSLDQFDGNFNPTTQTIGKYLSSGYAPFNAVLIDTQLFVTHAKMSNGFVAIGPGYGGYVDIFDVNGNFERNLISQGQLDEPWGVAIAPANFGSYSGMLLVGNFGNGEINAFNRSTGAFVGTLNGSNGNPIVIPGLWALVTYNGSLYYTAGPNGGVDGVFGKITLQ